MVEGIELFFDKDGRRQHNLAIAYASQGLIRVQVSPDVLVHQLAQLLPRTLVRKIPVELLCLRYAQLVGEQVGAPFLLGVEVEVILSDIRAILLVPPDAPIALRAPRE